METKKNLLQRLAAVQGEIDYIQKEKRSGMNYSIVSHDAVTAAVRPLMVKHGVLYYPASIEVTQDGNRTQAKMAVVFVNVDEPTDLITVATIGYGIDTQDKGPGKAMSYCVKYALLKTLGLETGDDPDQDQNVKHEPAKPAAKAIPKAEARPEYTKISAGIKQIKETGTTEDLRAWYKSHSSSMKSWDADWLDKIVAEFDEASESLKAKAT